MANPETKFPEMIRNSNKDFIKDELRPFLKIPSNTLNHEGIMTAKNFLVSYVSKFSDKVDEFKGEINPLIIAKVEGEIKESLLIYMMYDTQPISHAKEWISNHDHGKVGVGGLQIGRDFDVDLLTMRWCFHVRYLHRVRVA